ncbi:MAG: Sua5 family C-terminal domain-containing protein, partial [Heyndrickxia sp.]
ILRPGGVTKEAMEKEIGNVEIDPALHDNLDSKPKAPGMKYTHYAPNAPVYLVDGKPEFIQRLVKNSREEGLAVGVIATEETTDMYDADVVRACGSRKDLFTVANKLYDTLRSFNSENIDIIYSEVFPTDGVGLAIMNRLEKAAGHKWIYENESL